MNNIVLHARIKGDNRDWPTESWDCLAEQLINAGYVLTFIGSRSDYCPTPGEDSFNSDLIIDKRSGLIEDAIREIVNADLVVGQSSGVMHVASLCKKPHFVWGDPSFPIPEVGTSYDAYLHNWNPHQTPVAYAAVGWAPAVDVIFGGIEEFITELTAYENLDANKDKIFTIDTLSEHVAELHKNSPGIKVGLTNGVFDLLHRGHKHSIAYAKSRCDYLIVLINSDESTKRLKGDDRPVWSAVRRMAAVTSLDDVDATAVFDEDWPEGIITRINPDVIFKGESYKNREVAGASGRELAYIPEIPNVSTTKLIVDRRPADAPPRMARNCHTFWSGETFDLIQYLCVKTALIVHKPDTLFVWTMVEPRSVYWDLIITEPNVRVVHASEILGAQYTRYMEVADKIKDEMLADGKIHYKEAQISDMVAWAALYRYGGVYLDIDTISYRPFWDIVEKSEFVTAGIPATGVMAASVDSEITSFLMDVNKRQIDTIDSGDTWSKWTKFGPTALMEAVRSGYLPRMTVLDSSRFYAFAKDRDYPFTARCQPGELDDILVLHYYGAGRKNTAKFDPSSIDEEFIRTSPCIFATMARLVLSQEEVASKANEELIRELESSGKKTTLRAVGDSLIIDATQAVSVEPNKSGRPFLSVGAIMKNESANIARCLNSIKPIVDQYVLLDTGSTDDTIEVAHKWFADNGITNYKILEIPWEGFTPSRNRAIQECDGEYIMKMDLDEEMIKPEGLRRVLELSGPKVVDTYCYSGVRYTFPRVWHRSSEAVWREYIHEIVDFKNAKMSERMVIDPSICHVEHHARAEHNPELERTTALCRKALDDNPNNARAMFYLARECFRLRRYGEAEYWYKRRIDAGQFWEEVVFSYLYMGDMLLVLGRSNEAVESWEGAVTASRGKMREPFMRLADFYFEEKKFDKAKQNYDKAVDIDKMPNMHLFLMPRYYSDDKTDFMLARLAALSWRLDESVNGAKVSLAYLSRMKKLDKQSEWNKGFWKRWITDNTAADTAS